MNIDTLPIKVRMKKTIFSYSIRTVKRKIYMNNSVESDTDTSIDGIPQQIIALILTV
jgi:hypothetical protein